MTAFYLTISGLFTGPITGINEDDLAFEFENRRGVYHQVLMMDFYDEPYAQFYWGA